MLSSGCQSTSSLGLRLDRLEERRHRRALLLQTAHSRFHLDELLDEHVPAPIERFLDRIGAVGEFLDALLQGIRAISDDTAGGTDEVCCVEERATDSGDKVNGALVADGRAGLANRKTVGHAPGDAGENLPLPRRRETTDRAGDVRPGVCA